MVVGRSLGFDVIGGQLAAGGVLTDCIFSSVLT